MILDDTLVLSDAQAITADAASTNIIDIGAAGSSYGASSPVRRDIGIGTNIPILVTVVEAFNNLTSLAVSLQVDDDPAFGSPTTVATGPAIPLATLTLGRMINWPAELPEGTNERYVRLFYDVTGAAPTTGKITAAVVAGRQSN
jgi:hypothetical protein